MFRIVAFASVLVTLGDAHGSAAPTDCRNQTSGDSKSGNLTIMSYHIHYMTNLTGMRLLYDAFMKEFYDTKKLPFPPGDNFLCPFGPNDGGENYPYVCPFKPFDDLGAGQDSTDPPGPFSSPAPSFFVPPEHIDVAWNWISNNRFGSDILRHTNTGCMHDDHSVRAVWALEDPKSSPPPVNIYAFPCNVPGTGCNDTMWGDPIKVSCGCRSSMPLQDDSPENSCSFCISHGGIIQNLTFECTDPPLQVKYDKIKYYNGEVRCGNLFLESDIGGGINIAPTVTFEGATEGSYYTLMMVDPDADLAKNGSWPDVLTPGSHATVRHWVVGNLDKKALVTGDFSSAFTLSDFVGPSPPWGSHRYGQFLFEQPKKLNYSKIEGAITNWNVKEFMGMNGLSGRLVASNWHITQHAALRSNALALEQLLI